MDNLWINLFLVTLTCTYWALALLVLLLRVYEPHFANVTRYGGRSDTPIDSSDKKRSKDHSGGLLTRAAVALERSPLGRVRVSRKWSFCAFYVTGLAVIAFLLLHFSFFSLLPLSLSSLMSSFAFAIHCAVRLWECRSLHRFRGGAGDRVSLFAAFAGMSFYIAAALSSAAALFLPYPLVSGERAEGFVLGKVANGIVFGMFCAHIVLQVVQVRHHAALAKLRQGPKGSYCFPRSMLFAYVMEPHYACEILMYALNTISIWIAIASLSAMPALTGQQHWILSEEPLRLLLLRVCCILAPLGVTIFSFTNLRITAGEHRRFWNHLNAARPKGVAKEQLPRWDLFYCIC